MRWRKSKGEGTGRSAPATVLAVKKGMSVNYTQGVGYTGVHRTRYHVRLLVAPPGEPAFEVEITTDDYQFHGVPIPGQPVRVNYDPADHTTVTVDRQARLLESAARRATDQQRRQRIRDERAEQGLPPIEATEGPDPVIVARLQELEQRKARGELTEYQFRLARVEVFKDAGF